MIPNNIVLYIDLCTNGVITHKYASSENEASNSSITTVPVTTETVPTIAEVISQKITKTSKYLYMAKNTTITSKASIKYQ